MTMYRAQVIDSQLLALSTRGTASGAIATFETDMTEDLIDVECDIQYSQASGTPTPQSPIPITVYNSLNLSHSGADTSNPTVYNIPFGQTVAKGKLNVTTGVLRVTLGYVELDGSNDENWTYTGTRFICTTSDMLSQASRTNVISNRGVFDASSTADGTIFGFNGSIYYYLSTATSLADFKTWLSNNHLQVVYPLETSYDIQLSATQITALLNENNIWCDTNGDTSVKYILSVGKAIS